MFLFVCIKFIFLDFSFFAQAIVVVELATVLYPSAQMAPVSGQRARLIYSLYTFLLGLCELVYAM